MKSYTWTAVLFLAFASGIAIGFDSVGMEEPRLFAPLAVDYCSLVKNQDYLVGAKIQTKAVIFPSLEGAVLVGDTCPDSMLVFEVPNHDACMQRINSDNLQHFSGVEYSVQIEGTIRGRPRRRFIRWLHEDEKAIQDPSKGPPRVTFVIDRILSCTKK
jgi:hypothetical protein